jgi:hypothetical protein
MRGGGEVVDDKPRDAEQSTTSGATSRVTSRATN